MEDNNHLSTSGAIVVSGAIIGGLVGGIPGFVIGGLIGSVIQEIKCPRCGGIMKFINGLWRCQVCGYTKN